MAAAAQPKFVPGTREESLVYINNSDGKLLFSNNHVEDEYHKGNAVSVNAQINMVSNNFVKGNYYAYTVMKNNNYIVFSGNISIGQLSPELLDINYTGNVKK